jgi:predicted tellurium resistance membrane protein TerC
MEVVLGIDNLIFISILTNKLPEHQRARARRIGMGGALILRLGLLGGTAVIVQLTEPVFSVFGHGFPWRDMILIAGGLFVVWKATKEVHHNVDRDPGPDLFEGSSVMRGMGAAIGQILLLDLVFSIDGIITAVGMTDDIPIMVAAVLVTVAVMLLAATPLGVAMLALGFLLLIGHHADCRRLWGTCAQRLHLRGNCILGAGRGAEPVLLPGGKAAAWGPVGALTKLVVART